ncbi:MAG: hypothetical protein RL708_1911, partial [Bacteroidota bacterium]
DDFTSYNRDANILNEAFADIFGLMIDREVKGYCDWKVGNDISDIHATRNFQYPNLDVNSTTNGPSSEKYHDSNWFTNINGAQHDLYVDGGVLRHWFYLLAMGDASNGLTGIGIDKARRIAFNTFKWWLWHNCNYVDASNASFAAAEYTYGSCSPEALAVNDAWALVGLGIQLPIPDVSASIIVAPSPLCSNFLNVSVPVNLKATSSDPRATFTWNTLYNVISIPHGNGNSYLDITNFNGYAPSYISVTATACQQTSAPYVVPLPWSYCGIANRLATKTSQKSPNSSNNSTTSEKRELLIYPNPANSEIQLLVNANDIGKQYQIYNQLGQLMFSDKVNSLNLKINVSLFPDGLYLLNILSENGISQSKFEISNR